MQVVHSTMETNNITVYSLFSENFVCRIRGDSSSRNWVCRACGHEVRYHSVGLFWADSCGTGKKIEELSRVLCNVCNVVPGGIVCFFPSYDYEKLVIAAWEKSGVLAKIQLKKKVLREPKRSGLADQVLAEYSDCIKRCKSWQGNLTGAILMCVVGGKMSEGINFSDDLGRCIVMVGLPFPNINSPELKEKMNYLNANFPKDQDGRQAGQIHYENLCMKAVNQSIGRAIRHKDDYASILLLDQRYLRSNIVNKLPGWISKHLQKAEKFPLLVQLIPKFFSLHKK